jgi:hypothetical protein
LNEPRTQVIPKDLRRAAVLFFVSGALTMLLVINFIAEVGKVWP